MDSEASESPTQLTGMAKDVYVLTNELSTYLSQIIDKFILFGFFYRIPWPFDPLEPPDQLIDSLILSVYRESCPKIDCLQLRFDSNKGLKLIRHRTPELTQRHAGQHIGLDWLGRFLTANGKRTQIPGVELAKHGMYYVYKHVFSDGSLYIGKGNRDRWLDFKNGRSNEFKRAVSTFGQPLPSIIEENLDEQSAYELEAWLIHETRKIYGYHRVLNRTDGKEKTSIGDMPIGSLAWATKFGDADLGGTDYDIAVNLFMIVTSKGGTRRYYEKMPLYDAAQLLGCTMNEVIQASKREPPQIGDYLILNDRAMQWAIDNWK